MTITFILFVVALLVVVGAITYAVHQVRNINKADRIINGEEPATEEQINKIITTLLATKNWVSNLTEADRQRVDRLREIRNEMVTR